MTRIKYTALKPIKEGGLQIDARFGTDGAMDIKVFGQITEQIHKHFKQHRDFFGQLGLDADTVIFSIKIKQP